MHQHASRDCSVEAIGGAHHGPVLLYLSSVPSAATADGSAPFFKIFESGLVNAATNTWGNDVLNQNCGKQSVTLPKNLPPGDYLLRAETIALHAAGQKGGAQFYMSCYQIRIEGGGGGKVPQGVSFPGAYKDTDEGILINSK